MIKIRIKNKRGAVGLLLKTIVRLILYAAVAAIIIIIFYEGATIIKESLGIGIVKKCDCLTCTNCDQLACANCAGCEWESNACQSVAAPG